MRWDPGGCGDVELEGVLQGCPVPRVFKSKATYEIERARPLFQMFRKHAQNLLPCDGVLALGDGGCNRCAFSIVVFASQ